jgi:O-Antigen ligase
MLVQESILIIIQAWISKIIMNEQNTINEKYLSIFVALLPLFMYLGRALFYIHFALISVLLIFLLFDRKSFKSNISKFTSTIILYFVFTFIVNAIPNDYSYLNNLSQNIIVGLMVFVLAVIMSELYVNSINSQENQNISVAAVFWGITSLSVMITFGFLINMNLLHSLKYLRVVEFNDAMFHSAQNFLAIGFPFILFYFFKNKTWITMIGLLFCVLATFVSQGRTSIIVVIASTALFLVLMYGKHRKAMIAAVVILLAVVCSLSVAYISSGDPYAFSKIHTSNRLYGTQIYLDYVVGHAPLFGLGVDGSDYLRDQGIIPYGSPHNIFLESYVSLGLIGFFGFCFFILLLLKKVIGLWQSKADLSRRVLVVTVFIAIILDGQAYMSIWSKSNMTLIFFYLLLAVISAEKPLEGTDADDKMCLP